MSRILHILWKAICWIVNVGSYFAHLETCRYGAYEPYDFSKDWK
jgi:hypothetical protein